MLGGIGFVSGKGTESVEPIVAKDTKPMVEFDEIGAEEMSGVVEGIASSNHQDGRESLVDPPIKGFLASPFEFFALLIRQDKGLIRQDKGVIFQKLPPIESYFIPTRPSPWLVVLAGSPSSRV